MRGSVIRNAGKASRTRTPKLAAMAAQVKVIEQSADLGAINAILCMIIECSEKAAAIRAPVEIGSRLLIIAKSARSIQADISESFEKLTA